MTRKKSRRGTALFANIVLGAALAYCLAVLVCAIARKLRWAGGGWHHGMLIYAGARKVGLVFFGISLRLRESWRTNLALVVLSIAFSIYAAETILFLAGPGNSWLAGVVKRTGLRFDPRTKYEVVKDLRGQGVDAVPFVIPHDLLLNHVFDPEAAGILPVAGISGKTTVLCNESGYYAIYTADEHGFNNPRGLHKFGAVDIALIGDSFVHGFCVRPGEDIAGQLRSEGLRALNLGVGGSGPLLELALLSEYAVIYHPKIVLWFYFENDDIELLEEEQSPILRKYLIKGFVQNLRNRQPQIDQVLTDFLAKEMNLVEWQPVSNGMFAKLAKGLGELIKLYHLREFLWDRLETPITYHILPPSQQFQQVFAAAKERVRAAGGKLYFVYLPSFDTIAGSQGKYRAHHDQVLSAINALGIDRIDFLERIDDYQVDPRVLFAPSQSAHYSAAGYSLLRDVVIERLVKDGSVNTFVLPKANKQ